MRTSRLYSSAAVCAAFIGGVGLSAQLTSAMASLNPRDAVRTAPKNHKVLFENDNVRLLEVTIQPGETENMHLHQYSSVIAFNASTPTGRDRDAAGVITESQGKRLTGDVPHAIAVGPEAEHQSTNTGTWPVHFFRLEFKQMEGDDIMKKKSYP